MSDFCQARLRPRCTCGGHEVAPPWRCCVQGEFVQDCRQPCNFFPHRLSVLTGAPPQIPSYRKPSRIRCTPVQLHCDETRSKRRDYPMTTLATWSRSGRRGPPVGGSQGQHLLWSVRMDAATMTQSRHEAAKSSGDSQGEQAPLSADELRKMDAYWRASNYLSVGQIYLLDNPLLQEPLKREHIKPRLLGHWGTSPGLNMLCVHLNRVIKTRRPEHDLHHRPRARRPVAGGPRLSRRHLQRGLSEHQPGRRGHEEAVQAVQLPRRHPQPRRPGNAGQHPRRRRTRATP